VVPRIGEWDRAGDRALSDDELAAFWRECETLPAARRDCLRFLLALGGQRASQVLRAPWDAYDFDTNVLHLRDTTGAAAGGIICYRLLIWRQHNDHEDGQLQSTGPLFIRRGTTLRLETISKAVTAISTRLATQHQFPAFRFGDLRRTCETTLARLGVSKDVRAWLLSHRRSSAVQTKYYDRNTYLPEKKAALEAWAAHLLSIQRPRKNRGATVHSISGRKVPKRA
jgi:integrase